MPVLFSSHQLELVEHICESVAIIDHGRLVACGGVDELRDAGPRLVRVQLRDAAEDWTDTLADVEILERAADGVVLELGPTADSQMVLDAARLAGTLLTMLAARVYERAILLIGAPVGLRVALRGEATGGALRHPGVSGGLRRWGTAVLALLAGAIVLSLWASQPLAILLIAAGLLRIVLNQHRASSNPPRSPS